MTLVMGTPHRQALMAGDEVVWLSERSAWESRGAVDTINGCVDSHHSSPMIICVRGAYVCVV